MKFFIVCWYVVVGDFICLNKVCGRLVLVGLIMKGYIDGRKCYVMYV